jgi:ring-1,2-phenylacetyl-CoA epoxidase subunit PaaD
VHLSITDDRAVRPKAIDSQEAGAIARAYEALAAVPDPEIPALSVIDLGIIRSVEWQGGILRVGVSPTYTGCPATVVIRESIVAALQRAGFERVSAFDVIAPPWTSDWISAEGRRKLHEYGIAPPAEAVASKQRLLHGDLPIACPRCGSSATERISEFGSTPCKAHYRCSVCREPFDYFKCI